MLRQKTFTAVRWTTFAMISRAVFMLLQMMILARCLPPSDLGLIALVSAFVAFAQVFSDMGISNAIIHHQKISQEVLSSLYWLNVMAGAMLMLLVIMFSPLVAHWYHQPRLNLVLTLVSSTFLITALGQQLRCLASKNMCFRELAFVDVPSSFVGFLVLLVITFFGGGIYAFVAGMVVNSLMATSLLWLILADGWKPLWRMKLDEVRSFLSFGVYALGSSLTSAVNMYADVLIGGRLLGVANLGAFSLSKELSLGLAMLINPIVTRVGLPVMAQVQDDKAALKSIYLKTLLMTASVNFPLYFMMAAFSPEIVSLIFGGKWKDAIPLLRILAFWGMVRSTTNPSGSLILALGHAKLAFLWSFCVMLFLIPSYWAGVQYGVKGLAISMLITIITISFPQWIIIIRPLCGADFSEYFKQLSVPFLISVAASSAGYILVSQIEISLLRIGVGTVLGLIVYLILSYWFNRTWFVAISELILGSRHTISVLN